MPITEKAALLTPVPLEAAVPVTVRTPLVLTETVAVPLSGLTMVPNARSEVLLAVIGSRTVAVPAAVAVALA